MFKTKGRNKTCIIFDIGTGSVGGALVRFTDEDIPEIVFTTRRIIKFKEGPKSVRIISSVLQALNNVCVELSNDILPEYGSADEIHCVFSGLWHTSSTKTFHINNKEAISVDESLFIDVMKSQEKSFYLKLFDKYNPEDKKIKIIEKNIIQTKLNGYKTSNPYMKKANNIEISTFISAVPSNILLDIEETISRTLNINNFKHHTFSYIAFSSLRDIFEKDDNFIFIDISGELTEVIVVKDDVFVESMTFPIGKNTIIREVSKKLDITSEEATSRIPSVYSNMLAKDESKKLINSIATSQKKWQVKFKKVVSSSDGLEEVPKKIFFMSDDDFSLVFEKWIKITEITKIKRTISEISKIDTINDDLVNKYVKYSEESKPDPFMGISSVFINNLVN